MLKKFIAVTTVLTLASAANAEITADIVNVFKGNLPVAGTYVSTWDLQVTVSGDDSWTAAGNQVDPFIVMDPVAGGTFFQDGLGGNTAPNPAFFPSFPDLEYDTFFTSHLGWPNTTAQGAAPGFANGPVYGADSIAADWFLAPDLNFYPGTFTIARISIIPDDPGNWFADVDVKYAAKASGGTLFTLQKRIPEPASLALLALGGLAAVRRR